MPFTCSICGEESSRICVRCTKDACNNHLCEKCRRCSDCCECEVTLAEQPPSARSVLPRHEPPVVAETPAVEPDVIEQPQTEQAVTEPPEQGQA
jgi:hypothetical protein